MEPWGTLGTRRLLDNAEQIRLAMAIKELLHWKATHRELPSPAAGRAGPDAHEERVGRGAGL